MPDIFVHPDVYKDSKVPQVIINRAIEKFRNSPIRDLSKKGKWQETLEVDDVRYVGDFKALNDLHVMTGFRRTRRQ